MVGYRLTKELVRNGIEVKQKPEKVELDPKKTKKQSIVTEQLHHKSDSTDVNESSMSSKIKNN